MPQGLCVLCADGVTKEVHNVVGYSLCNPCNDKTNSKVNHEKRMKRTKRQLRKEEKRAKREQEKLAKMTEEQKAKYEKKQEKKHKKKVKEMVEESESTQTIYVVGTPKDVQAEAKKLKAKETKYEKRQTTYDARRTKLEAKIKRLEEKKTRLEEKMKNVRKNLANSNLLEQEIFKNKKIEMLGRTKDGGDRFKISGKWYMIPSHLIGEKQTLVEIVKTKEKAITRKISEESRGS